MTVRDGESKRIMRHSSSWPERSLTVKVRINPSTRAYTISPSICGEGKCFEVSLELEKESGIEPRRICVVEIEENVRARVEEHYESDTRDEGCCQVGESERVKMTEEGVKCNPKGSNGHDKPEEGFVKLKRSPLTTSRKSFTWPGGKENFKGASNYPKRSSSLSTSSSIRREKKSYDENPGEKSTDELLKSEKIVQGDEKSEHACPKCTEDELLLLKVDPFKAKPVHGITEPPKSSKRNCPESGTFAERRSYRSQSTRCDVAKFTLAQRSKSFGGNLERNNLAESTSAGGRPGMDQRKEATLRRHYYPEGGWGYVIVTCSALVHFLGIGLQLATPGTWHVSAELKFHHPALHSAGQNKLLFNQLFIIILSIDKLFGIIYQSIIFNQI